MRSEQEQEFVAFVDAVSPRLLASAWLLTGDPDAAQDLVQEALARLYVRWRRVRGGNPTAYARRVLTNLHTDQWRSRRREVLVAEPGEFAGQDPDAGRHVDVVRALQTLPPREREVVVLRHYLDLSEEQTADSLGVSIGTVKSSASRGLGKLREILREGDGSHVGRT